MMVHKASLGNNKRVASGKNDASWTEVIQVLWREVLERFPEARSTQLLSESRDHSLSHLPDILTTLLQSAFRPPLGTVADPGVSPIFRMQRLVRHAKFEIFHLLPTL